MNLAFLCSNYPVVLVIESPIFGSFSQIKSMPHEKWKVFKIVAPIVFLAVNKLHLWQPWLKVINNLKDIENSPHLFVPDASVLDMLYSESNQDLEKFVRSSQSNKKFMDKDSTFWIELIRKNLNVDDILVMKIWHNLKIRHP